MVSPTRRSGQRSTPAGEGAQPAPVDESGYDAAEVPTAATPIVSVGEDAETATEDRQGTVSWGLGPDGKASADEGADLADDLGFDEEHETDDLAEEVRGAEAVEEMPPVPAPGTVAPPEPERPLTATQLANDPLLGTHDEILVDVGLKLRGAAVVWAGLGVVASWLLAGAVSIATGNAIGCGWAAAASILIVAGTVWYLADVSTRFSSVPSYRKAKTPQAIARLDHGAVVGLIDLIGMWVLAALVGVTLVCGAVAAVLTVALHAGGWTWLFGAVPAVLLYLYAFVLLHRRLLEKARDAVA